MITISHLTHRYKLPHDQWVPALEDITLNISEGEYVTFIGPNGSGKSTLVRCLNGLIRPTSGHIRIDQLNATDPDDLWEVRRHMGMVFQNPDNQIVSATVEREIAFGLENIGLPTPDIRVRVHETLHRFNLLQYRHYSPHRLSGGEKQRLAIASVMAMEPQYLILDEPTSLLDPRSRHTLTDLLEKIHAEGKTTIVHITQFPEEAIGTDRLIILVNGTIVKDGDPVSIFNRPDELYQWGLEPPVAFRLNAELRKSNLSLPPDILVKRPVEAYGKSEDYTSNGTSSADDSDKDSTVATDHLSYTYDIGLPTQQLALTDVSLCIQKGERIGLIGPTGSGKTTLAEHLIGLLKPSSGSVHIEGIDLWVGKKKRHEVSRKIGLVFQFPELQFFEENVQEEVAFGPKNLGLEEQEIIHCVNEALEVVGLDSEVFKNRSPLSLSSGEQRLVAIASILSMKPDILIFDEPTAGLDPQGVRCIFNLIQKLNASGTTIILITHHIDFVARVAERVIVLHEGKIVLQGSPRQVFRHFKFLTSIGLDIPELGKIMRALHSQGWNVSPDVYTLQEAIEEIVTQHPPPHPTQERMMGQAKV
jgi:energy-coupling factor transporter ATPase